MILLFIAISQLLYTTTIKEVVNEFHELSTEDEEVVFIDKYKNNTNPSITGYVIAMEMKQAEYVFNPAAKLKIFKKSKNNLNVLIEENPNDVHLRYIRLVLQENTPGILGYNDFIEEDKLFLKNKMTIVDDSDYLDLYINKNTSL